MEHTKEQATHKKPEPPPDEPDPEGPEDEAGKKTSGIVVRMPWAEPASGPGKE